MILFRFFDVELLGVPVSCIIVLSFDNGITRTKSFVDEDEVYAAAGSLCGDFCDLLSVGGGVYLDAVLLDGVGLVVGGFIGGGSMELRSCPEAQSYPLREHPWSWEHRLHRVRGMRTQRESSNHRRRKAGRLLHRNRQNIC